MPLRPLTLSRLVKLFVPATLLLLLVALTPWSAAADPPPGALILHQDGGIPIANASVRLLCFSDQAAKVVRADLIVETGADGTVTTPLPGDCSHVAALWPRHVQPAASPAHGPAYTLYTTSWVPGTTEAAPVAGILLVSNQWPLALFHVTGSLAWQPAAASLVPIQLRVGLFQMSSYLYDLSEGQMAIGPVRLYTGGQQWESADLRFLAANDTRPSAYIGGIVPGLTAYESTITGARTLYAPGAVLLGRGWDGVSAGDPLAGAWNQPDAYRTLAHEWMHYAAFLYDEYQQATGEATYCTCDDLPQIEPLPQPGICGGTAPEEAASVMSYHYIARQLWHPITHGVPFECTLTQGWSVHGRTDWEVIRRWTMIQGLPAGVPALRLPAGTVAGPRVGLTAHLFGRQPGVSVNLPQFTLQGTQPSVGVTEPPLVVQVDEALAPEQSLATQLYTLAGRDPAAILHQGRARGSPLPVGTVGTLTALGVTPQSQIRLSVERYATEGVQGKRWVYPPAGEDAPPATPHMVLEAEEDLWLPALDATFALSGTEVTTLTLHLESAALPLPSDPLVKLCLPDRAVGCPTAWTQTMQQVGVHSWEASFAPLAGMTELPLYTIAYIDAGMEGELVRWLQITGGVGPAHEDALAPLRDGPVMVDIHRPLNPPGACNRVMVMPATNPVALRTPPRIPDPNGPIEGIVGQPLDIDIRLPAPNCPPLAKGDHPLGAGATLTMFFPREELNRLGIGSADLRLLHFSRGGAAWVLADRQNVGDDLDWISALIEEDGIYAIGWVAP